MRIRTIKPEFWESESNARLCRDTRLVFIGLLNMADDSGRLHGHPGRIAGALLSYDTDAHLVVVKALDELESAGKIRRYESDGCSYIHITKFSLHQKIDKRLESKIPPPPIHPDELALNADFTPIHPSYTMAEQGTGNREQGTGNQEALWPVVDLGRGDETPRGGPTIVDVEALRQVWNANKPPRCVEWRSTNRERERKAKARLREQPDLAVWAEAIKSIAGSGFLQGENDRGWQAGPEWLLKPSTLTQILEGSYRGGSNQTRGGAYTESL